MQRAVTSHRCALYMARAGKWQSWWEKSISSKCCPQSEGDWLVEAPKPRCLLFLALLRGRKALAACRGPPLPLGHVSSVVEGALRRDMAEGRERQAPVPGGQGLAASAAEPSWASTSPTAKPPLIHLDGGDLSSPPNCLITRQDRY